MRMKRKLVVSTLVICGLLLILTACTSGQTPQKFGPDATEWDRGPEGAKADAAELVGVLSVDDAASFTEFLAAHTDDDWTSAAAADVRLLFHQYFDVDTVDVRLLQTYAAADRVQYDFALIGSKDGAARALPLWVHHRSEPPHTMLTNQLLHYGPYLRGYLERYLALLRARDAQGLVHLLTPDDVIYPIDGAQALIERYHQEANMQTLDFLYGDFGPMSLTDGVIVGFSHFAVTITGQTAAGEPLAHPIQVIVGDGLMGLDDPWEG